MEYSTQDVYKCQTLSVTYVLSILYSVVRKLVAQMFKSQGQKS